MRKKTSTAFSMILPIKYDSSFSFELGSSFASKFLKYQFDKYATWSSNPSAPRNLSSSFFFSCDQKSNVESFQKNREYFISKRSQDKSSNDWVIVLKVSPIFIDALLYIYFSALKIVVLFKTQLPNNFLRILCWFLIHPPRHYPQEFLRPHNTVQKNFTVAKVDYISWGGREVQNLITIERIFFDCFKLDEIKR